MVSWQEDDVCRSKLIYYSDPLVPVSADSLILTPLSGGRPRRSSLSIIAVVQVSERERGRREAGRKTDRQTGAGNTLHPNTLLIFQENVLIPVILLLRPLLLPVSRHRTLLVLLRTT